MKNLLVGGTAVLAAWTCVACGASSSAPSARSPSPLPPPQAKERVDVEATGPGGKPLVFGPHRVGPLRLGMTHQQVADTDAARVPLGSRHDGWPRGCRVLQYRPERLGRTPGDTLNGALSARQGLEQMYATRRMVTPEGISLGSTVRDVRDAYGRPDANAGDLVVVAASRRAVYRIQLEGVVTSLSLEMRRLDCTI